MIKEKAKAITNELLHLNKIEIRQKKKGQFVADVPISSTRIKNNQLEFLNNYFFKQQDLYISKHNRFASYPLHSHQFTELNYMLSGSCRQIIDGQSVTLHQGELLLIGIGASHEITPLGDGDLLINILFNKKVITVEWINQMAKSPSPLIQYLLNLCISGRDTATFIKLNISKYKEIQTILENLIAEYYSSETYSRTLAVLYLPILFTALAREYSRSKENSSGAADWLNGNKVMLPLLRMIEENYKDINLTMAANQLGYNRTYLGNLIKKEAGITFTQMVAKRRLYQARLLLNTTNLPISDIAREAGFSNKTYFYNSFKEAFGYLPSEEKKQL